jgi:DNA-binding MarR family transcriptional regulator
MSSVSPERTLDVSARERFGASFKAVVTAMRRLRGRQTHAGRAGSISYAQYGLLFGLAERDRLSVRELGERVELTPATVTQMLDALQEAGLVSRQRSEEDRRVVLSSLTEHGRAVVRDCKVVFECRWRDALAGFSDEQLLTAAAVLDRVAEHFDHFDEAE